VETETRPYVSARECNTLSVSLHRGVGEQRARDGRRRRMVDARLLAIGALSALWAGGVAQAQAAVQAPGYSRGPSVVSAGLLWAAISSDKESVYLSTATSTRLLVPDAELSAVRVEAGWVVAGEASGPKVGRIGRRLRAVQGLRRCPPIEADNEESDRLEAVTDGDLYAVVRASCLRRRPGYAQFLVRVRLGTGNLHVVGRVPSGAISLAAAGPRVALTYHVGAGRGERVEVLDSRNARPLYRVGPPPEERSCGYFNGETQLDSEGDVLVTGTCGEAPFLVEFGWWGGPETPVGRPVASFSESTRVAASLSEGRIAYVTAGEGESESIDVLNLATGNMRTVVTFSGSARVDGIGLGQTVLAWAHDSYEYALVNVGEYLTYPDFCVGTKPAGSTELTETLLSASAQPIAVSANPGPRPAGPACEVL